MTAAGVRRGRGLTHWKNVILLAVAVLVVNLPTVVGAVQHQRLSGSGVDVRATVLQHRTVGADHFLAFSVPRDSPREGDPSFNRTAQVDQPTYDVAVASGVVTVRVLPGSTSVWRVPGQVTSRLGLYLAVVADLLLLLIVLAYVRFRSRLRPTLVLRAEADLESCAPGAVLDRISGQRYVVCGDVESVEDDAVVLVVGDRRVRVVLDGHHNPAGSGQPVLATGTMIA